MRRIAYNHLTMKRLFITMYPLFIVTAVITHLWTALIAHQADGITSALLSLFLPFLSELYWANKMLGHDNIYVCITAIHLTLGAILILFFRKSNLQNTVSGTP